MVVRGLASANFRTVWMEYSYFVPRVPGNPDQDKAVSEKEDKNEGKTEGRMVGKKE